MARFWRLCALLFVVASTTVGCTDVIGRYRNESVSMQPGLYENEYLFTDNLAYATTTPRRGDIILFNLSDGQTYIKRVIGLPGETLEIRDGKVLIDGVELNEPYVNGSAVIDSSAKKIATRHYFVMGDNRANSRDSRSYGPIDQADIIGRAVFVYAPAERMRLISRPKYNSN